MEKLSEPHLSEVISPYDFDQTLLHLERAIANAGLRIFANIDHAAGAREFGLEMPPTIVLIYGHPKGGTPLMLAYPDVALDLPLKLLIRVKTDGKTSVLFRWITSALAAAVPDGLALKLAPAQKLIVVALGSGSPDDSGKGPQAI